MLEGGENMNEKTCCVTGHREIPATEVAFVKQALRQEIALAIDEGFTHFLSGMAEGTDLIFAEIVAEFCAARADICLEAAIPYRDRLRRLEKTHRKLLECCGKITVVSEDYAKNVFARRNQYMVERSERVIAVYDGRKTGGTAATIRMAERTGADLRKIFIGAIKKG